MLYKNKKTGEVMNFACTINGNAWEPLETPAPIVKEVIAKKPVKKTVKKVSNK